MSVFVSAREARREGVIARTVYGKWAMVPLPLPTAEGRGVLLGEAGGLGGIHDCGVQDRCRDGLPHSIAQRTTGA